MNTAILHADVQRHRFIQHAIAAVTDRLPRALRPAQPDVSSSVREAQNVRAMAYAVSKTDPGFAADLYAAAARHEGLNDE